MAKIDKQIKTLANPYKRSIHFHLKNEEILLPPTTTDSSADNELDEIIQPTIPK